MAQAKTAILPGPKPEMPDVVNEGLEEALAKCGGNLSELGRRLGTSSANIKAARNRGMVSESMAIDMYEMMGIPLHKSLGKPITCRHCRKKI